MSAQETLLPLNRTKWEGALSQNSADRRPLPWELISRVWNPWTCPEDALPYLANGLGIDLWFDEWPIERKRLMCASAFNLARLKGRVEGIRRHLPFVDARLLRAETPPGKTFTMPAYTDAERRAFLSGFAELRVYPYIATGHQDWGNFTTAAFNRPKAFLGAMMAVELDTWSRYTRKAYIVDKGVTTNLTVKIERDGSLPDEIRVPAKTAMRVFLPSCDFRLYPGGLDNQPLIFKINRSTPFYSARESRMTINPKVQFIEVDPEFVAQGHPKRVGQLFPGGERVWQKDRPTCYFSNAYLPETISWQYLFERWFIFDPTRVPEVRKRSTHLGYSRLGVGKFTAFYQTKISNKFNKRETQRFVAGFLRAPDKEHVYRATLAVRVASAARDQSLINLKINRVIECRDRLPVGSVRVGQLIGV